MTTRANSAMSIEPPQAGGYVELIAGIIWVRLPVPGALAHVNVWLLPAGGGWWLIDTGMHLPVVEQAWAELARALRLRERLRGVIVTHHHPDHLGCAARLAAEHGVAVRMSAPARVAATRALQPVTDARRAMIESWAAAHGVVLDDELWEFMTGNPYGAVVAGLPDPSQELVDGEVLDFDTPWRVTLHEGHAPGHACLHAESLGLLISGDQVLPSISPNISLLPANRSEDPLGQYLESLAAIRGFHRAVHILPSHGQPFRDLHARVEGLTAEHGERLARIEGLLIKPAPLTVVVDGIFGSRRPGPLHRLLAIGETLAHLRHLELAGRVERCGMGPGLRWRRR